MVIIDLYMLVELFHFSISCNLKLRSVEIIWNWFIMVIELSGVQFGLKSNARLQNWFDFRPKLHDTKFNYYLIISILKS